MSIELQNKNVMYNIDDFTISEYVKLLQLAKKHYKFIDYHEIEIGTRFILWRHDCDFSLNRALKIAKIEKEQQVKSTFFINPHCDFYNIFEKSQSDIIKDIVHLGHQIGLHFDASYYDIASENQLDDLINKECLWIENCFGISLNAFSFHNPTPFLLSCEKEQYGGLINCYSGFLKKNVSYCSDSNGYWRFRRLYDVLEEAGNSCLQVLTHPGWWQEEPMLPRDRVLRSVTGRAKAVMDAYDSFLKSCGRVNVQ